MQMGYMSSFPFYLHAESECPYVYVAAVGVKGPLALVFFSNNLHDFSTGGTDADNCPPLG